MAAPTPTPKLLTPFTIGNHTLSTRIVMAPLTRFRNEELSHAPVPFVKDYYVQRASTPGTLIISEGTVVCERGTGWTYAPGIWSAAQIAAWKDIVDAVHAAGGVMFMQLFAAGRSADPKVLDAKGEGWQVKGPSAVSFDPVSIPHVEALTETEIHEYIRDFAQAARNAVEGAGFDGVEVHGANGYLLDQFTQSTANHRTDAWGGSIEARARFALEVTRAVVHAVGAGKVGFRISPWSAFQGMKMASADAISQFTYLLEQLKPLNLAYLHLVESRIDGAFDGKGQESLRPFTQLWGQTSPILLAGGFSADSAQRVVEQEEYAGQDIAVVFGRWFLANPDLVFRIRNGIALNSYTRDTFYVPKSEVGYTDYPFSEEFLKARGADAAGGRVEV